MTWDDVTTGIAEALRGNGTRAERATAVAELIGGAGYRWVGIYDIIAAEVVIAGWSQPGQPTYPRFPRDQGLNGAAVASAETVVVGDVTRDPRYLTAFGDTLAEIVVPVRDPQSGDVVGTLDVESGERDAFSDADRAALERCAAALLPLYLPGRER